MKTFSLSTIIICLSMHSFSQGIDKEPEVDLWDTTWSSGNNEFKVEAIRKYSNENETGVIELFLWKLNESNDSVLWRYKDSLSCDWQDVIVELYYSKVLITDVDGDNCIDVVLTYILDCTTDVSPLSRTMICYNPCTNDSFLVSGLSLDPATPGLVEKQDIFQEEHQDIEDEDYNPYIMAGKITETNEFANLPKRVKEKLISLWMKANVDDMNIN